MEVKRGEKEREEEGRRSWNKYCFMLTWQNCGNPSLVIPKKTSEKMGTSLLHLQYPMIKIIQSPK